MVLQNSFNQSTVNNSITTQSASPFLSALGAGAAATSTGVDITAVVCFCRQIFQECPTDYPGTSLWHRKPSYILKGENDSIAGIIRL